MIKQQTNKLSRRQKNIHFWVSPEDAAKCCHPDWKRQLVCGDGANQQNIEGVMFGRKWVYVGKEKK